MKDEDGKEYRNGIAGVLSTGSGESQLMKTTFYLESTYFEKSKKLELYIEGCEWLEKGKEKLKLDLVNVEAEQLPDGVIYEKAKRVGNDWFLTFSGIQYHENTFFQIWDSSCNDEMGVEHNASTEYIGTDLYLDNGEVLVGSDKFYTEIKLEDYHYDTVFLKPIFTRKVELDKPIKIKIK